MSLFVYHLTNEASTSILMLISCSGADEYDLNFFVCLLPRLQCQGGINSLNKVIVLKLSQCVHS